ncbi:uncharacterized protein PG998_013039 [Apiospora kogelbergensis]|uniref:uncharacterized protein n=1 Tax=Apiospora kogelbergensis TaxID=1337665 RepID=UPI0031312EA7
MSAQHLSLPVRTTPVTVHDYTEPGFNIYRTSFKDDELFQRFIDYIRKAVIQHCESERQVDDIPTMYTKEEIGGKHLRGLSVDEVRRLHMEWVATTAESTPRTDNFDVYDFRAEYFMLVNDEVLEGFRVAEDEYAKEHKEFDYIYDGAVAIMCIGYEDEETGEGVYLSEATWQYIEPWAIAELYDMIGRDPEWWFAAFVWPPGRYGWMA